jgi:hypothetical protein
MRITSLNSLALPLLSTALLAAAPAAAHSDAEKLAQITSFFVGADVVKGPDLVDCTLSGGTQTTCFSITVRPNPKDYTPGPWCPTNIADDADKGGIWFLDGKAVDVDGDFISKLAKTYGDTEWQLFDADTGAVRFTGSLEACEAAARPDVDPDYQNYCVQCLPEYLSEDAATTYVIPLTQVPSDEPSPTNFSGSGVAVNGVRLDGPAPVDAILGAHTIAPFDDCGGHVNIHVGYHYHAVTDCLHGSATTISPDEITQAEASFPDTAQTQENLNGGQIGIAMDGYPIFANLLTDGTAPQDLDSCNGHSDGGLPYHYHVGEAGSNQILGCLAAQSGCVLTDGETVCKANADNRPPRP